MNSKRRNRKEDERIEKERERMEGLPEWQWIITFLGCSVTLTASGDVSSDCISSDKKEIYPIAKRKVSTFDNLFSYGKVGIRALRPSNASLILCILFLSLMFAACRWCCCCWTPFRFRRLFSSLNSPFDRKSRIFQWWKEAGRVWFAQQTFFAANTFPVK